MTGSRSKKVPRMVTLILPGDLDADIKTVANATKSTYPETCKRALTQYVDQTLCEMRYQQREPPQRSK